MKPYLYILREKNTDRKYVGVQYNKNANPEDLMTKYFTSNKIIKENSENYIIERVVINKNARELERRYLRFLYKKLGKEKFLSSYINRNLAPGILLDKDECNRISERMKKLWKTEKRRKKHQLDMQERISNGFYKKMIGKNKLSSEAKKLISERMKKNNPMFNDVFKQNHKNKMNTPEMIERKKQISSGNKYNSGKKWYNNGSISKMFSNTTKLTEGWVSGRLNPHWNYKRKKHD